jgi:glutamate synthase domain-containing protein 2
MKNNSDQQKLSPETEMALAFLCKRKPSEGRFDEMPQSTYALMVMEFLEKKGENALQALAGFYCWMIDNKKGDECTNGIVETFSHDLGERNDKWSLPRSSEYLEFWKKEVDKIPQRMGMPS